MLYISAKSRYLLYNCNARLKEASALLVVGRKNYLFAGSHKGAEHLAMIYSLLDTCKLMM